MPTFQSAVLPFLFLVFIICSTCDRQGEIEYDYRSSKDLSEAERRLPENAVQQFELHPGLEVELFAAEPMLINPTNIDVDERGRVWTCTAQNYRRFNHDHPGITAGDRILILEDTDQDGIADQQKVFYQGNDVNAALGIAKLGNKVYVAASPSVLVFTDENGDDIPDHKDTLFTGLDGVDHDHGVHAVVFGPEGKLYFNFGNEGKRLRNKQGEIIIDKYDQPIEEGESFRQGMVFRCDPDGSNVEILGHNFRNNFEVAVDAYGTMWQSDNDDDGNRGTRINYVMDYGNYGFKDEMTGAAWQQDRIGMHEEIPKRHWHLNDPGVVPNLLQTGAGSPTGIMVYEGVALPAVFHGQMIHCEPGQNVVRSYPVTPDGAGYTAEIIPLVTSSDSWFRPSDVCAAPDGSLIIADWYDAGVGGHLMADIERGRLFRLYAEGKGDYRFNPLDLATPEMIVKNLDHVNQASRYIAFQHFISHEANQEAGIRIFNETEDARLQARILYALSATDNYLMQSVAMGQQSKNPELRKVSLRIARQRFSPGDLNAFTQYFEKEDDIQVVRETLLSMRYLNTEESSKLWANFASRYDGRDRWYLEALGIAADIYPEERFTAYLARQADLTTKAAKDIVWRLRSERTPAYLYDNILAAESPEEMKRYFRAMHFLPAEVTATYLAKALYEEEHPRNKDIVRFAMASISEPMLNNNARIRNRLSDIIGDLRGTDTWTLVARKARLVDEAPILLDSALVSSDDDFRAKAASLAVDLAGHDIMKNRFEAATNDQQRLSLVQLAHHTRSWENNDWLFTIFDDAAWPTKLRHQAAASLANDWTGQAKLLERLKNDDFAPGDDLAVAEILTQAWRSEIKQGAIAWISENRGSNQLDLAAIAAAEGDEVKGKAVFNTYCQSCHVVGNQGVRFGPALSEIGDKLGGEALLSAIVYPNQGIGFGYEGFTITMNNEEVYQGYIESQTEDELTLRMMGGVSKILDKEKIAKREPMTESLMTANLHLLMEEEEMVDLLAYLKSLKKQLLSSN